MIKLFIFDLSDVCFTSEEPPFLRDFAKRNNLNFDEFDNFYQQLLVKAEVDEISSMDVWQNVLDKYSLNEAYGDIMAEMMSTKEKTSTLEFVKSLRGKYKTAYLTNYSKGYWEYIQNKFDLSEYFDFGLASYQIKARKPAKEGFLEIIKHFDVKPEEVVYTDDSEGNLVNAKEMGINVIHFKTLEQFKEELKEKMLVEK
jgi:HAD superfamily hydrolase (TIGR01509 family)